MAGKAQEKENALWIEKAREFFAADKPEHFTNYLHCCECYEHDETLRASNVVNISLQELGNPGWGPVCFTSIYCRFSGICHARYPEQIQSDYYADRILRVHDIWSED